MQPGLIVEWTALKNRRGIRVERSLGQSGPKISITVWEDGEESRRISLTEAQYTNLAAAMFGGADITALQRAEASTRIMGTVNAWPAIQSPVDPQEPT